MTDQQREAGGSKSMTTENPSGESPLSMAKVGAFLSKAALCTAYVIFAYAHFLSLQNDGFRLSVALLVAFESVMVVLVFFRRDTSEVDLSPVAVVAGLVGSFAMLGFRPVPGGGDAPIGQVIQVGGVLLQLGASFSLGRSFGLIAANRGIKTVGLYKLVRHPFYMAYLVSQIGYTISNPTLNNVAVTIVGTAFQVLRIHYEERLLLHDQKYASYAERVRWHLIPGVW